MHASVSTRPLCLDNQGSAYFPENPGQVSRRMSDQKSRMVPLSFPATKDVLWDRTPVGASTVLHIIRYRNVSLHILEKSVQLAHRHALQSDSLPYRCFLIGSVITDKDEEGVTLTIDRFDPGRDIPGRPGRMPTARLPGDHVIPLIVSINKEETSTTHSMDDFIAAFKLVEHNCSSHESLDVGSAFSFSIHCCCYDSADDVTFNLHIGAVTMGNVVEATPVNPVPIIPTALARNLTGPLSLSEIQGAPKVGYVTMDQTRKLLLLLESDPKACTLPLVGIWLSGLSNICSPFVWACCLRYMFNSRIHERVCTVDQGFLLVMFSPTSRQPTFYECHSLNGDKPSFELVGCRENVHFYKHAGQTDRTPVQLELTTARDGPNRAAFMEAIKQYMPTSQTTSKPRPKPAPLPHPLPVAATDDDVQIMPRPSPKPLIDKSPVVTPSVPELSLIFDSFVEEPQEQGYSPQPQDPMPHHSPPLSPPQQLTAEYRKHKHLLPSNTQENQPFRLGQNSHARVDRGFTTMGHLDTPPGRPGPLRPVNTNLPHVTEKLRKPEANNPDEKRNFANQQKFQRGTVINTNVNTKQTQLSMKPKKMPSPAQSRRGQQQLVQNTARRVPSTHQANQSDSTPRQKPPRPASRKSEIMQSTLPLMSESHQNVPLRGKGCGPPRRMSYPVPASSQYQKTLNGSSQHHPAVRGRTHQVQHSTEAERVSYQHQTLGMFPGHLDNNAGHSEAHCPAELPWSANPSHHAASSTRSPGAPTAQQTSMSSSPRTASCAEQSGQTQTVSSIPCSQPSTYPYGLNQPAVDTPLTVTRYPQPRHGPSDALEHTGVSQSVDPNLAVPHETDNSSSNQVHSAPANLAVSYPTNFTGSIPQAKSHDTLQHGQGRPLSYPYHAHQRTDRTTVPLSPSGSAQEAQPQPSVHQGPQGVQQDQSRGGMGLESNGAMVQLMRQEQLIQQLQAQIQMLLQAQCTQSTPPIPSGLITPPATPTSPVITNQQLATPASQLLHHHHNQATPTTTHSISTDSSDTPPLKTMHSMAVMTGKSLLWPDETGSPVHSAKNRTSVATSMTPQARPSKGSPQPQTSTSCQDVTLDPEVTPETDPNMTLPLQHTRNETQSTVFDVSAVELRSFTEEGSPREASPARSPDWKTDRRSTTPHSTHPETTQGTYPMDSLHSPVLGESASTCAPPRRRSYPSDLEDEEEEEEEEEEDGGKEGSETEEELEADMIDPPVSLLYRDEKKFYQNLLGKVEQMLTDQTLSMGNGSHGDAMTTQEELRQLGLTSGGNCETIVDRSIMYRSMCMVNSDFFPRINYVSLMDVHLDSPNLSYEANAIAMKYLTEEELTQLSAGFKGQSTPPPKVNPLLRSALTGFGDVGLGAGLSAVDLSMASRKYMEKYGLLEASDKKPGRARALAFDTVEETPAQRIVANNSKGKGKLESNMRNHHHKASKTKTKSSLQEAASAVGTETARTKVVETQISGQQMQSPKQEVNAEGTDQKPVEKRSGEKVPPQKLPHCSPNTQPLSAPRGQQGIDMDTTRGQNQPHKGEHKTVDVKGRDSKRIDTKKKSGGNILDIERLKQLPKLF